MNKCTFVVVQAFNFYKVFNGYFATISKASFVSKDKIPKVKLFFQLKKM